MNDNDKVSAALVLTLCCPHCLQESRFHVEPLKLPQERSTPIQTPLTAEKSPINEPGATVPDFKSKLWTVLEALNAREGESDRQLVTDFLRAAKAIRKEQEPENFPVRLLPWRPSHLGELGLAIARFRGGEPAQIPYPPNEPVLSNYTSSREQECTVPTTAPTSKWSLTPVPYGPIKGTALGQLPPDVQFDLWNTFSVSVTKGPDGKPQDLPVDRKFRTALDEMGIEKEFVKP